MTASDSSPIRLAACREDLQDGKEWSLHALNDGATLVAVVLTRLSFEWGDRGHSIAPAVEIELSAGGHALLWREGWEGAEMNLELTLQWRAAGRCKTLWFELGKLYRRRDAQPLAGIGAAGWLFSPARSEEC